MLSFPINCDKPLKLHMDFPSTYFGIFLINEILSNQEWILKDIFIFKLMINLKIIAPKRVEERLLRNPRCEPTNQMKSEL